MLDPAHPITPFFDDDPERVIASLPAIESSSGKVHRLDTLFRKMGERELRGERDGLFDARIFGAPGSFGHIETTGVIHPSVYPHLVGVLGFDTPIIVAIAHGEKRIRGDELLEDEWGFEEGDLTGPRGIAEIVRRRDPDHPMLPLLGLTRIPVPPLASRPSRMGTGPEAIDGWIGPVNEAWLEVIRLAYQDSRLQELETPLIILANAQGTLQRALDEVYKRTRRGEGRLVPAILRGRDDAILSIAFADPERIVIQRGNGVRVVDIAGREIHAAPPSGCTLRGVVQGRYAVFHEYRRDYWPFSDDAELWPEDFVQNGTNNVIGEISVLDVHTGQYLERMPPNVPRVFVENDQPEDLLLGNRKLDEVGGDRPSVAAYTHDLRFALISGDSSQIISLANGLTHVRPATMYPDEIKESLDLRTGAIVEHEWWDEGGGGDCAIAFADGRWFTFDNYGVLFDHIGNDAIVIVPRASAAAFDPAGRHLAIVIDPTSHRDPNEDSSGESNDSETSASERFEDDARLLDRPTELVIIDRATRGIVSRFPV